MKSQRFINVQFDENNFEFYVESINQVPFEIARVSYFIPPQPHPIVLDKGAERVVIAARGTVIMGLSTNINFDGFPVTIDSRREGIFIAHNEIARLKISPDCVCIVLSSKKKYVWDINFARANVDLEQNLAFSTAGA